MKITILAACLVLQFSAAAFAQSDLKHVECQSEKLDLTWPTREEWKAKNDNLKRSTNLFIDEYLWQERRKNSERLKETIPARRNKKPFEISWEEAKKLIVRGCVPLVFQGHNQHVYLTTNRGSYFVAKEPAIDNIFVVVSTVDPCGLYIQVMTE